MIRKLNENKIVLLIIIIKWNSDIFFKQKITKYEIIRACINDFVDIKLLNVITHPCSDSNGGLVYDKRDTKNIIIHPCLNLKG